MSNFVGMDTAAVSRMSADLKAAADRLSQIATDVDRIVHLTSGHWNGQDAHDFRQWWSGQHRPKVMAAVSAIVGLGQSAANNASDQTHVSGGATSGVAAGLVGAAVAAGTAAAAGGTTQGAPAPAAGTTVAPSGVTGARDWREIQAKYDAWATGRFAAGGESYYQCTAWANYRWHELGYAGTDIHGNGGAMAANAGSTSHQPTMHAMASYGPGTDAAPGHVMIVEEVRGDGAIRVSEMNATWDNHKSYDANIEGHPDEYRDNRWITRSADGNYYSSKGQIINFAAFKAS